jgi:hypothetical protein
MEGKARFGALVLVDAILMQRVAATAGRRIVERQTEIVATEKPFERPSRRTREELILGRTKGLET